MCVHEPFSVQKEKKEPSKWNDVDIWALQVPRFFPYRNAYLHIYGSAATKQATVKKCHEVHIN